MQYFLIIWILIFYVGCSNIDSMTHQTPPQADKEIREFSIHNDTIIDNYFWMRLSDKQKKSKIADEQTQKVLDYLNAENEYLQYKMSHTTKLQTTLFNEIKDRIKKDDSSVPVTVGNYSYYSRYEKDKEYPFYCRKVNKNNATEEIMLNVSEMAKKYAYYAIGGQSVSTNENLLAYGVDTISRREYTLYVKDLSTGKMLEDKISNTTGSAVWANDNKTFFYTKQDPVTLRSYQIYKHILGTDESKDVLVYEEKDDTFGCYIAKTKSKKYIIIGSYHTL